MKILILFASMMFAGFAWSAEQTIQINVDKSSGTAYVIIKICVPVDAKDILHDAGKNRAAALSAIAAKAEDAIQGGVHELVISTKPTSVFYEPEPQFASTQRLPQPTKTAPVVENPFIAPPVYCATGTCSSGVCSSCGGSWTQEQYEKPAMGALHRR